MLVFLSATELGVDPILESKQEVTQKYLARQITLQKQNVWMVKLSHFFLIQT